VGWLFRLSECIDEFYVDSEQLPSDIFKTIFNTPNAAMREYNEVSYMKQNMTQFDCEDVSYIIDLYVNKIDTW
jgi:hypothetical protein